MSNNHKETEICSSLHSGRFRRRSVQGRMGFTLIELLIVVAIIAILAAIAVPNFLEAQTRAKVSRVRSDLRTIATALETFRIDNNKYPYNDGVFNVIPVQLSTPIAYLTNTSMVDPFNSQGMDPVYGELARFYTYNKIVNQQQLVVDAGLGYPPPVEAVDMPGFNPGAFDRYGFWKLVSVGPDRKYSDLGAFASDAPLYGADMLYDATNGTVSWGNLHRTQKHAEGVSYE